jgi:uncharacterized protein YecE (DUF72 family)
VTEFYVGTSGFSYAEWKGRFYPEDLAASEMLRFYAQHLTTVEINNTFYRMPKAEMLLGWSEQVPAEFRFVLKASRRITHQGTIRDASDSIAYLFKQAKVLHDRLGAVLFQLPPYLRKDVPLLEDFLALLPAGRRAAVEFRHESWFDDAVYAALGARGAALCVADVDEDGRAVPLVATTDWGYLRLRRAEYPAPDLAAWAERLRSQPWQNAYVFFKHEQEGPRLAARLSLELLGEVGVRPAKRLEPAAQPPASPAPPATAPAETTPPQAARRAVTSRRRKGRDVA